MYKNNYDTDCVTWSPQGRIFQAEYAMEAVRQGSCCVGIRSNTHVVLAALSRSPSKLASYQEKLFKIDDILGIAMSGITADAKFISKFMQKECMHHRYAFDEAFPSGRLVQIVAEQYQVATQRNGRRPYGVGLLIAANDKNGCHLYEICPSGNYTEAFGAALGSRCQSSKTYMEKHFHTFPNLSIEELILQAVISLNASLPSDQELTVESLNLGVVGDGKNFKVYSENDLIPIIEKLKSLTNANSNTEQS